MNLPPPRDFQDINRSTCTHSYIHSLSEAKFEFVRLLRFSAVFSSFHSVHYYSFDDNIANISSVETSLFSLEIPEILAVLRTENGNNNTFNNLFQTLE